MMKVSNKTTYALRAMMDLCRTAQDQPQRLPNIAERQNIPLPFLEQIFFNLKKAGLVTAIRGPQGGYRLGRDADAITLGDIVTVLEGPFKPVLCSQPEQQSDMCHDIDGCLSRFLCNELDGAVFEILRKNTIGYLVKESERLRQSDSLKNLSNQNAAAAASAAQPQNQGASL